MNELRLLPIMRQPPNHKSPLSPLFQRGEMNSFGANNAWRAISPFAKGGLREIFFMPQCAAQSHFSFWQFCFSFQTV